MRKKGSLLADNVEYRVGKRFNWNADSAASVGVNMD